MNRFKVKPEESAAFEARWLGREVHLGRVPGFIAFHMLKGPTQPDHVLYASHTLWRDHAAFEDWTRSDAFRLAHRTAGDNRSLTLSHPEFEGFEVIQEVSAGAD